jgi:hypothetical protein
MGPLNVMRGQECHTFIGSLYFTTHDRSTISSKSRESQSRLSHDEYRVTFFNVLSAFSRYLVVGEKEYYQ